LGLSDRLGPRAGTGPDPSGRSATRSTYTDRCAPLTVYLLDYDDLRADDDLAEDVEETGALPQVPIEAGLARAMAEYRAVATRQARVRRATETGQ
jgi:hypothetical protein